MEDSKIIELYFQRDEKAIVETQVKYGGYCYKIVYNILFNNEDSQECLNDTYLDTWNSIPPHRPEILSTFIGKIARRRAIDTYRKQKAEKRLCSEYALSLDELEECVGTNDEPKEKYDENHLIDCLNNFLKGLKSSERKVFVCRYYYFESIDEISNRFSYSESKVKMMLKRTRDELKDYLIKEGYNL